MFKTLFFLALVELCTSRLTHRDRLQINTCIHMFYKYVEVSGEDVQCKHADKWFTEDQFLHHTNTPVTLFHLCWNS
jgi:hypothetical protein